MADDFAAGIEALRRRMGGISDAKPPLAALHEAVRLLPPQAHKALLEAGVNLERPSKDDQGIIDDLRHFNKLPKWQWVVPATAGPRGQY